MFLPHEQAAWERDVQTHTEPGKAHGRRETRTITTTTWLNEYLSDWPQLGQVFRLERTRVVDGTRTVEVVYGITSWSRAKASAAMLLGWSREHWGIENGLHYVRDETLGEDRCRVRTGASARVLASLRNVAIAVLRERDAPNVAAATRELNARPDIAASILTNPKSNSE
jgi:Transposase DDE domain